MKHQTYTFSFLTRNMEADTADWFCDTLIRKNHPNPEYNEVEITMTKRGDFKFTDSKKRVYKPHEIHPNYKDIDTGACQIIMSRCLKRKY